MTEREQGATPRPWRWERFGNGQWDGDDMGVMRGYTKEPVFGQCTIKPQDAALIVSAVNAHDAAVKLAEAVLETPGWVKAAVQTAHDERVYEQWNRIVGLARAFQHAAGGAE